MKSNLQITCPTCTTKIDLDSAILSEFKFAILSDAESEMKRREQAIKQQKDEVLSLSAQIEQERLDIDNAIQERLKTREQALKESITKSVQEEKEDALRLLEEELKEKSLKLREHNKLKTQFSQLTRQYEEKEIEIQLKAEQQLSERLAEATASMKEKIEMEAFVKVHEQNTIIKTLQKKIEEAGKMNISQKTQGTSLETAVTEILRSAHPSDLFEETKVAVAGADILQHIRVGSEAGGYSIVGKVLYEVKNASWSPTFIQKLKSDSLAVSPDISVIVMRNSMPKGIQGSWGIIDGVWVVKANAVADLSLALRLGILRVYSVLKNHQNRDTKEALLLSYMTSEEFKNLFEHIQDNLSRLQMNFQEEQKKLALIFKKREQYLAQVLSGTMNFLGKVQGISDAIPEIEMTDYSQAS